MPIVRIAARTVFILLIPMVMAACDPLAPDPTTAAVLIKPTETALPPTATATLLIEPTHTHTPLPSATPTRTPVPSRTPIPSRTPMPTRTPAATVTPQATQTPFSVNACGEKTGQINTLKLVSDIAGRTLPYRVYVPPCYFESGRRFPYVILMHGADQDETEWTDTLNIQKVMDQGIAQGALPPMILVMPYGGEIANDNDLFFAKRKTWEDVVLLELMPDIERYFCTWNTRLGRGIGGISRGGFWAYEIGLRHPELFSAIGGHSAYFDFDHAPKAFNPLNLATDANFGTDSAPRFWLDVGKDDPVRPNVERIAKLLQARDLDVQLTIESGVHDADYWSAHLAEYLAFYGAISAKDISTLPSCLV